MIDLQQSCYLLFDGDCGICTYLSEVAARMDTKKRFKIVPYRSITEGDLGAFRITYEKCAKRIYVISRKGRVYPGAFGLNYFLLNYFPWSILIALIYLLPPVLVGEIIGYRLVAANRRRISEWFGLKACAVK